jgi:tight adherence protein C
MDQLLLFLIPAIPAVVIFVIFVRMSLPRGSAVTIEERLSQFAERPASLEELELQQPFYDRVIKPMVAGVARLLGRMTPAQGMEKLRQQLVIAGNPYNMGTAEFTGARIMAMAILGGVTFFGTLILQAGPFNMLLYTGVMALAGYLLPVFWLRSKIKARQKVILKTLPDAIDLMTISVEAGLAFDGAMQRVADKWDNELGNEFRRAISEMRVGKTKREVLHEMVQRTAVPDLGTFVASIIQADQLGVSIAKVLRIQSEQMRIKRRQRAEEQAHKAPILMMIPMVFLIFPSTYIVLLGPAVPKVMDAFGGGGL